MSEPVIRNATKTDLPKIKEIIDHSFPRFFRYFALHSVSDFSQPTILAKSDEKVAGFAKLINFTVGETKCGCILWIAVHPSYHRKGFGVSLINAGVSYLKESGANAIFASTQRGNKGALAAFGRAGFERTGFLGLWRLFGWCLFEFYSDIWYAPSEIVLMYV